MSRVMRHSWLSITDLPSQFRATWISFSLEVGDKPPQLHMLLGFSHLSKLRHGHHWSGFLFNPEHLEDIFRERRRCFLYSNDSQAEGEILVAWLERHKPRKQMGLLDSVTGASTVRSEPHHSLTILGFLNSRSWPRQPSKMVRLASAVHEDMSLADLSSKG